MKNQIKAGDYLSKLAKAADLHDVVKVRYQLGKANGFVKAITAMECEVPKSLYSRIESYRKRLIDLGQPADKVAKLIDAVEPEKALLSYEERLTSCDTFSSIALLFEDAKSHFAIKDPKRGVQEATLVSEIKLRTDAINREIVDFILADKKKLGYYLVSKTMPAKKFVEIL